MELESASSFDCESFKNDISRIKAVLKKEQEEFSNDEFQEEIAEDNNCDPNEAGKVWGSEFVHEDGSGESDDHHSKPQIRTINRGLKYCFKIKQVLERCLMRLSSIEEEILLKQKYLEEKLMMSIKLEVEEKKKIKYYKPINLFATPYFRDVRRSIPSPNEDSILKKLNNDIDAYVAPPRPWIAPEHKSLREAVIENAREKELEPLIVRQNYYKDKVHNGIVTEEQIAEITEKLEVLEKAVENVRTKSVEELLASNMDLDWMRISALMYHGNRTAEECERMWYNYLHPSINKLKWTKEEDRELFKVATKYRCRNWDRIACELKLSKRTPIQCLQRFQSHLNRNMLKSAWTLQDDEELKQVIEQCRIGDYIPWNQVTYLIDGRSRIQVINRWARSLAPSLVKGPWSEEEDAILIAAVERYGYQWTKMEALLPGRSNFACRERYTSVLVPGVIVGNWTPEEDLALVKLLKKYPNGKWTKIASFLPGRTDNMCLTRAARIKKYHPRLFKNCSSDADKEVKIEELYTPTHNCKALNSYRKSIRATAIQNMVESMRKIKGCSTAEEAEEAFSKASRSCLVALSNKLLEGKKRTYHRRKPRTIYPPEADITDSENDDLSYGSDDDEELYCDSDDAPAPKRRKEEEEISVEGELDSLFMPIASFGFQPLRKGKCAHQSRRGVLERKLVKSLLYKALQCVEDQSSEQLESDRIAYKNKDFSLSVPSVCRNIVFHHSSEMPVLPPNRLTLEAFKFLLINRKQLVATFSENPCQNPNILSVISSNQNYTLFCASCYQKGNYVSQPNVVVNIPSLPEDSSEERNGLDGALGCTNTNQLHEDEPVLDSGSAEVCSDCQQLNELRREYHLLHRRLFSLFLWPALLTMTEPTDQQKSCILDQEAAVINSNSITYKKCRKKRKKRWGYLMNKEKGRIPTQTPKRHPRKSAKLPHRNSEKIQHAEPTRRSPRKKKL